VKRTYFTFDIDKMFLRPLLSVIIMSISVYVTYNKTFELLNSNGISTIISIITGIIVYIALLAITRCISIGELLGYMRLRKLKK
jgi:hypothetical protein